MNSQAGGRKAASNSSQYSEGLIAGRNPVAEAIRSGKIIDSVYVSANAKGSIGAILDLCRKNGIAVKRVDDKKLDRMSGVATHQGVIAAVGCAEYFSIAEILAYAAQRGEDPFVIICDEIEDPHNLGAIIRTAEAAGAHGVIIPKRRSASLTQTVFKTSAGAASYVKVARVSNLASAIDELKQCGVWIYGTDADGEDYSTVRLDGPIGLVIGSEGFGIGRLIKEKCDFLLRLPMLGKVNSLNASVAAGIFMYEVVKQRRSNDKC